MKRLLNQIKTGVVAAVIAVFTLNQLKAQVFERAYGTALDNSFTKVVQDNAGNYYVLGQDEAVNGSAMRATVTRLDANGQHQWTLSLDFASQWQDAVLTPTGELMLVGNTLPFDPTSKGIMARVTAAGAFARLRTYDEQGRDIFTRIVRQGGTFPYYVIGAQFEPGGTPFTEDVILLNMDQDLTINYKKKYIDSGDSEYFRDMEALNATELIMAGNKTQGLIYKTNLAGTIQAGVQINDRFYRDVSKAGLGGFYAAATNFGNSEAFVQKFDNDLLLQWEVKLLALSSISQVWEALPGEIYVTGTGNFGNQLRTVVVKLTDFGGPVVAWVKYLQVGTGYIGGASWLLPNFNLAYTDARTIPNGFGQSCAFLSVSDLEMETCEVGTSSTDILFTDPVPDSPAAFPPVEPFPVPNGVNSIEASALNWQQQVACSTDPCVVNIVITPLPQQPCGMVEVCAQATGPGPYAYQWCNGSTTQCYTVQLTPCTPHDFCVSVTCSDGTVATDTEVYTVGDNVPPTALCLGTGVDLNANCQATITPSLIDGGSTDNCGIASTSVSPSVVSGCGLHTVTLTVTDFCGNTSTCSTQVQTIEVTPPVIQCPPSVVKNCSTNTSPQFCGTATTTDNCDPAPTLSFADITTGLIPCDGNIQRTWTAEDNCGNVSTCVQNIAIIDNVPPVIQCPPSANKACNQGTTPADCGTATATDNCDPSPSLTFLDGTSGVFPCDGTIQRTWTATDDCGRSSSCIQLITVIDNVPPTLTNCPQGITVTGTLNPNGICSANVQVASPTATDNCDPIVALTNSFNQTANASGTYPQGTTTVTWTAIDDCGNVGNCTHAVVVQCGNCVCAPTDLVISQNGFSQAVGCGQGALSPVLPCPAANVTVSGFFGCASTNGQPCPQPIVDWTLTGPLGYIANGSLPNSNVSLNFTTAQVDDEGSYLLTLTTLCPGQMDSCKCLVRWIRDCQEDCPGNLVQNSNFTLGALAGPMPALGSLANWQVGYGTPIVDTDFGCGDPVYVRLEGNKTNGTAIVQQLTTPTTKGKVYELSVCVRVNKCVALGTCPPYVKIRAAAFNAPLPNTGAHPSPNQDYAIMDISGRIPYCDGDWTQFVFHRWRAPKNFSNIAISVENSEAPGSGLVSIGEIDNICFTEVNDSIPCYLAEIDSLSNIIPPFGQIDTDCPILEDDVDYFNGYVNDIYAYCNPAPDGTDTWYEFCQDSCESIGGELPEELIDFIENDSINQYMMDSLGVSDSTLMSQLGFFTDSLEQAYSNANMMDSFMLVGTFNLDCERGPLPPQGPPPNDPNSPFNGMDIVFVHGLRTDPLEDKLMGVPDAQTKWPFDEDEFEDGGYWKEGAYRYWNPHTSKYLKTSVDPNNPSNVAQNGTYSNRYIVVSHAATQSFVFGAHATVQQIYDAMYKGKGVVNCNATETRPKNTFGHNGFIIISHSDGAPLTDIALTTSNLTQYPPLSVLVGDVSDVAKRCQVHVALQGAFGGSNYATLALMVAAGNSVVKPLASPFIDIPPTNWLFTSELLDMAITKKLWKPFMDNVPVCVLTLTDGHPTDFGNKINNSTINKIASVLAKHVVHHGFDDGVLSIESQSANPDSRSDYPNRYFPRPGLTTIAALAAAASTGNPKSLQYAALLNERVYDMCIHKDRAIRYYLDQKLDIFIADKLLSQSLPFGFNLPSALSSYGNVAKYMFASSSSIPWLSPTGMVQPVLIPRFSNSSAYDALKRYDKHYSFIQGTADHYSGSSDPFALNPDYESTYGTGAANFEESRVITSGLVYTDCGVSSSMKNLQIERICGKKKTFRIKPFKKTFTVWIWKRKYHRLDQYESNSQLDYLYKYLLKP